VHGCVMIFTVLCFHPANTQKFVGIYQVQTSNIKYIFNLLFDISSGGFRYIRGEPPTPPPIFARKKRKEKEEKKKIRKGKEKTNKHANTHFQILEANFDHLINTVKDLFY